MVGGAWITPRDRAEEIEVAEVRQSDGSDDEAGRNAIVSEAMASTIRADGRARARRCRLKKPGQKGPRAGGGGIDHHTRFTRGGQCKRPGPVTMALDDGSTFTVGPRSVVVVAQGVLTVLPGAPRRVKINPGGSAIAGTNDSSESSTSGETVGTTDSAESQGSDVERAREAGMQIGGGFVVAAPSMSPRATSESS